MTNEQILAIRFHSAPHPDSVSRLLRETGLSPGGPELRWYNPVFLTLISKRTLNPSILDDLSSLDSIQTATLISGKLGCLQAVSNGRVLLDSGSIIGDDSLTVMAGPCSVEGRAQVCDIAELVKESGATVLRGGAFKPRTAPYSFGGLGHEGLSFLMAAREQTGLPFVTEALDVDQVDPVARAADIIQIGTRNMYNPGLLFAVGSHPLGKPVLLKRHFSATIQELLFAAEYVLLGRLAAGHDSPGLILCERGIRTFDDSLRFTLDLGAIPVLAERTRLPLVVDPSHAAGARRFVPALAKGALAVGAQGLLIEVHDRPGLAWCDGEQSLDPASFKLLMRELKEASLTQRTNALSYCSP